jgi:uncharacterized protein
MTQNPCPKTHINPSHQLPIMDRITDEKLKIYFSITEEAFQKAKVSALRQESFRKARADAVDMVERYISDAHHFEKKGDKVNAFAALNYAHGWLDAGARIGLFDVHDSRLFTVDDK